MKPKPVCELCGQVRNGSKHSGETWEHDPVIDKGPGFGGQRRPMRPRSEKTARYYREERIPAVREAVGNGRRPCQVSSPKCTKYAETLHEPATRGRFGGLKAALEEGGAVPSCNACNLWIAQSAAGQKWAKEHGMLRSNRGEHRRRPRIKDPFAGKE